MFSHRIVRPVAPKCEICYNACRHDIPGDNRQRQQRNDYGFHHDNHGLPFALNYSTNNGSSFTTYYVLNLQGDVVKLVDGGGTSVASYAYDAWGDILSSSGSKAEINPLRYRGYYYDTETGFYYVSSRYYDPEVGRWIHR